MAEVKITIRMFIDAALQFSRWKCPNCNITLQQVWIGDDFEPDLHYVHCPKCEQEFTLMILFVEDKDTPQGR